MTSTNLINKSHSFIGPIALAVAIVSSFMLSTTNYGEFALLAIVAYIIAIFVLYREKIPVSSLHIVIYLFIMYIVINPYWSIHFYRSIFHILILCQIPIFFLMLSSRKVQESWGNYLLFLTVPALIASTWGIVEYIQTDPNNTNVFNRNDGFLHDPNSFAAIQYIFSILIFSLLYNFTPAKPFIRWGIWFTQFLVITALFLTLSRSGILIWFIFIFVIAIYSLIKNLHKLRKYVALHLILALISYPFIQILVVQVNVPLARDDLPGGLLSTSQNGRFEIWEPTFRIIAERPLLGWGLNSFQSIYPSIRKEYGSSGITSHNDYIQFTIEGGLVLLLFLMAYLCFHLYLFFKLLTRKAGKNSVASESELALMLLANLVLLLHSTTNFSFYIIQLCILSGLIFARVYYLSVTIGLIKQPEYINSTKTIRGIFTTILTVVMLSILYRSASGFLFLTSDKYALTRSLSTNKSLLIAFTSISPLDSASSSKMANVLTAQVNSITDNQQKKSILDYSISLLEPLSVKYPFDAQNYYNLGLILYKGYSQLPEYKDHYKEYTGMWMRSIEVDPSYIPPYLRLYEDLNSKKQYQQALSILERTLPWLDSCKLSVNNLLLIEKLLMNLSEQANNEMSHLYKELFTLANNTDKTAYFKKLREIKLRLKEKNQHEDIQSLIAPPNQQIHFQQKKIREKT